MHASKIRPRRCNSTGVFGGTVEGIWLVGSGWWEVGLTRGMFDFSNGKSDIIDDC